MLRNRCGTTTVFCRLRSAPRSRAQLYLANALKDHEGRQHGFQQRFLLDHAYSAVDRSFFSRNEFAEWATTAACVPEVRAAF